jgi:subtilase family serine protease
MAEWAFETSLDVEYAHAMAPGAKLLLVETPTAEVEGRSGFPDMMSAESHVIRHHQADVISQSFGATENTFAHPGKDIRRLRSAFRAARKARVTVLAGSGDQGVTNDTHNINRTYRHRVNSWPSSDPLVTSVGGTRLFLDASGNRTRADEVWNDGDGASGGGRSQVFGRPAFQRSVKAVTGAHRGTPDISMTAAVKGSALVYMSFPGTPKGFSLVGGTSEATPIFAGIVALADQLAGHDLGDINPRLYAMHGAKAAGIVDVRRGKNSFAGVKGFSAKRGYDLASGWGTVDAQRFVQRLAQ